MNNAENSEVSRRPSRRIDAQIDISPTGVLVNGEPVALVGTEEWLTAGIRVATERIAEPRNRPIRARVVNGPCRTRLVIHPDGSVADVREYLVPAWLERMAGGDLLARHRRPLLALTAMAGVLALVGGLVLMSGGERQESAQAATTTATSAPAGVGDLRREVLYAPVAEAVVTASVSGGDRAVVMKASADSKVKARWTLRDPEGRIVVDRVVALGAEVRRFRRSGLDPGDYRWAVVPREDGETQRGIVTVTRKGGKRSTAPASPDGTKTPGSTPAPSDAPAPAGPGDRSGAGPAPDPDPTTSEPDPTTSEPDPTTSEPDPTTSEPDPTTSEPDPTTSEPDPTTTSEPAPTKSGTTEAGTTAAASAPEQQ